MFNVAVHHDYDSSFNSLSDGHVVFVMCARMYLKHVSARDVLIKLTCICLVSLLQ